MRLLGLSLGAECTRFNSMPWMMQLMGFSGPVHFPLPAQSDGRFHVGLNTLPSPFRPPKPMFCQKHTFCP